MELRTDHSFQIGAQHLRQGIPCQDYALTLQISPDIACAVVSDGCSSGGRTDFGSRLLCLATERALLRYAREASLHTDVICAARDSYLDTYRVSLALRDEDLLATSLFSVVRPDGIFTSVSGDGTVVLQYEHGTVIVSYEWNDNIPYYPIYSIAGKKHVFADAHKDVPFPFQERITAYDTDAHETCSELTFEAGVGTMRSYPLTRNDYGLLRAVAVFSDGVGQVDGFKEHAVAEALLAFKNSGGTFAVRRMNRFLEETRAVGRGPIDDIAYAVILHTTA